MALLKEGEKWMIELAYEIVRNEEQTLVCQLSKIENFVFQIQNLLVKGRGCLFLDIIIKELVKNRNLRKINPQILIGNSLKQYSNDYLDIEGIESSIMSIETNLLIFNHLAHTHQSITFESELFGPMCNFVYLVFKTGVKHL